MATCRLPLHQVQCVLHEQLMKPKRGAPRIVFFSRWADHDHLLHIVECSMCVFDVTDYCPLYGERDCLLPDLVRQHAANVHQGVPRLVEAVR